MRAVEKRLRDRIKAVEEINEGLRADNEAYRNHAINRFKWWIELLGKGNTPSLPWLIEDDAKFMARVKGWWW